MSEAASSPGKGLRERNKLDKLNRIRAAARSLFDERGYDATTIRHVAAKADVGQGTVFAYAPSKRDLIFLIINDDNERMVDEALAAIAAMPDGTLIDALVATFGRALESVRDQGEMGRFLLREVTFDQGDSLAPQETRFETNRRRFMVGVVTLVERARARGEVQVAEDSQWIARVLFAVYRAEARIWLSGSRPSISVALTALRRSLALVIGGVSPASVA
jgi:AcrR family transcriptional regulator